ncbi:MAG: dipeptidase [Pseudomonadota bacterium]
MRAFRLLVTLSTSILITACGNDAPPPLPDDDPAARAERIAARAIIVDGHIDVPYRLRAAPADVSIATDGGDFDYPRALSGSLNAPFMSIYTPARLEASGESFAVAEELIDGIRQLVNSAPGKFALANSVEDVRRNTAEGLISLPLGMENGAPIEGRIENVGYFHERGIRYITLTHSLSNHISDSSYDPERRWGGLSDFGRDVVREMNRVGIMVDVSHVSDEAFYDVMEVSDVPVIASHSSARHFTPGFERNMSDEMIVRLAENGGVIMINYGSSFLTAEANAYSAARSDAIDKWLEENPSDDPGEARRQFTEQYVAAHGPFPYATRDDVLDHIDHVVELVGVDYVGIGSDYDGVGDSLPDGLKDVSSYPNLVAGLLDRGYSAAEIEKILGENLLRVWSAVEAYAASAEGA